MPNRNLVIHGGRLRARREQLGLRQADIVPALGLSQATLSRVERGYAWAMSVEELGPITRRLNLQDVNWLARGTYPWDESLLGVSVSWTDETTALHTGIVIGFEGSTAFLFVREEGVTRRVPACNITREDRLKDLASPLTAQQRVQRADRRAHAKEFMHWLGSYQPAPYGTTACGVALAPDDGISWTSEVDRLRAGEVDCPTCLEEMEGTQEEELTAATLYEPEEQPPANDGMATGEIMTLILHTRGEPHRSHWLNDESRMCPGIRPPAARTVIPGPVGSDPRNVHRIRVENGGEIIVSGPFSTKVLQDGDSIEWTGNEAVTLGQETPATSSATELAAVVEVLKRHLGRDLEREPSIELDQAMSGAYVFGRPIGEVSAELVRLREFRNTVTRLLAEM